MIRNQLRIAVLTIVALALMVLFSACGGSGGSVVPPPPPPPPAQAPNITTQPQSQTVTVGSATTFSVVASGTSPLNFQWRKDGANIQGATGASFTIASVAMSDAASSPGYTVVVSNTAGSATSNAATLSVNQPAPVISSITPDKIFCVRECIVGNILVRGSGFTSNQTVSVSHGVLLGSQFVNSTEILLTIGFDQFSWSPGFVTVSLSGQTGNANAELAFVGNLNTLAVSTTHAFQLDQGVGKVHRFRLSDGVKELEFSVGQLTHHVAWDDNTDFIVLTQSTNVVSVKTVDGGSTGRSTNVSHPQLAAAAKGGFVCLSQDFDNQLVNLDLRTVPSPFSTTAVGDKPHVVAMGNVGSDPVCIVYNREDRMLSAVRVTDIQLLRFVAITGVTPESQLGSTQGGWQLAVFNSGSVAGKTALLSQSDNKLIVVDLQSQPAIQLSSVSLRGAPFRIATNETDGSVVVAYVDTSAGLTRFEKIDVNTGNVTSLSATSNLLCTGFGVSSDGTKLYCANRDQLQILNNN